MLFSLLLVGALGCVEAPQVSTAPVLGNSTCPVSGEPVAGTPEKPTFTSIHGGVTIGFMCPAHLAEFEAGTPEEKDAWLKKAREQVAR